MEFVMGMFRIKMSINILFLQQKHPGKVIILFQVCEHCQVLAFIPWEIKVAPPIAVIFPCHKHSLCSCTPCAPHLEITKVLSVYDDSSIS